MDRGDLLFDLPPLEPRRRRPIHPASPRRQPIRNAILAYLTEPRTVKQIADRIGRRTSVATGHLRAMHAKNLIVRVSWGVWVRQDKCPNPPDPATIRRSCRARDVLLQHLQQPKTLADLEQITGGRGADLQAALTKLIKRDLIEQRPGDTFCSRPQIKE
jgi:hypothetical protein